MADDKDQELHEHEVLINGVPHTLMLTDEDAKKYETASKTEGKAKAAPANKSKSAQDK